MKIGFIGLGVMGSPMAEHLLKRFKELYIFSRTKGKAERLIEQGAIFCENIADLAKRCDVIITIVGLPTDVQDVYLGKNGLINNCNTGTILIDMTTSSPSLAMEIYQKAQIREIHTLDAPVSGGDVGAKSAKLSIMVGGDADIFEKCKPIFETLGTIVVYHGQPGSGQHTKLVNQIVIAGNMIGMVEALVYAKNANLDLERVLQSISKGAAASWQVDNNAPKIIKKDYNPGFFIKHFVKDMQLAQNEARNLALDLPGLDLVESLYASLLENGYGNLGTQALIKYFEDNEI
ncbi:MAG: 6-phosphogluconate dehydrogenase NAD-binding [Haloplasmataceae bacterium]|jgi:3-hydroxyisobutyrate dehydrogenase|nr:6-phosphogluconate dehydrogenase NAD-binding [Haloplasmataceae bacterium]